MNWLLNLTALRENSLEYLEGSGTHSCLVDKPPSSIGIDTSVLVTLERLSTRLPECST